MNIFKNTILILSGEGNHGTWSRYTGKETLRALRSFVTKESRHGDRWVKVYVAQPQMQDAFLPEHTVIASFDPVKAEYTDSLRSIDLSQI